MSLRLAVLALLTARSMTGFDLMRQFDASVGYLWNAPHTQIYPELKKLEQDGFIEGVEVARGKKGTKRRYSITGSGKDELKSLMNTVEAPRRARDPQRLRAAYLEWADPTAARAQLEAHIAFYREELAIYQLQHDGIRTRKVPLLQDRLALLPADQHEAVVEFKAFAYSGMIERARIEIEWAQQGLRLLDRLRRRVPITSASSG